MVGAGVPARGKLIWYPCGPPPPGPARAAPPAPPGLNEEENRECLGARTLPPKQNRENIHCRFLVSPRWGGPTRGGPKVVYEGLPPPSKFRKE